MKTEPALVEGGIQPQGTNSSFALYCVVFCYYVHLTAEFTHLG